MKKGTTAKLRNLAIGDFCFITGRTSEIYIYAKRLGIRVTTKKTKRGLKVTRILTNLFMGDPF